MEPKEVAPTSRLAALCGLNPNMERYAEEGFAFIALSMSISLG